MATLCLEIFGFSFFQVLGIGCSVIDVRHTEAEGASPSQLSVFRDRMELLRRFQQTSQL